MRNKIQILKHLCPTPQFFQEDQAMEVMDMDDIVVQVN